MFVILGSRWTFRLRLGVHKGIEWNDHKGMECNVFKYGKRIEKNGMEWNLVTLIGCFKIKELKGIKMNEI